VEGFYIAQDLLIESRMERKDDSQGTVVQGGNIAMTSVQAADAIENV
jgi:hypothetical protein